MLNRCLRSVLFSFLLVQALVMAESKSSTKPSPKTVPPKTAPGFSQQDCSTWSPLSVRTKFWKMSYPEKYFCRNQGGNSYECSECWKTYDGKPSTPKPLTLGAIATSCMTMNRDDKKSSGNRIGSAACMAYHIDPNSGRLACLSQTFEVLQCHAGHPDPTYQTIVCDQCTFYHPEPNDRGTIFKDGSDAF